MQITPNFNVTFASKLMEDMQNEASDTRPVEGERNKPLPGRVKRGVPEGAIIFSPFFHIFNQDRPHPSYPHASPAHPDLLGSPHNNSHVEPMEVDHNNSHMEPMEVDYNNSHEEPMEVCNADTCDGRDFDGDGYTFRPATIPLDGTNFVSPPGTGDIENSRGFIERTHYGDYVYRADVSGPGPEGFHNSEQFQGVRRMISGDNVLITSGSREGAIRFGDTEFGRGHYRLYRIDAREVRGASLMENVRNSSSGATRAFGQNVSQMRPIDIAEGAGEFEEVHIDNSKITPDKIKEISL